MKITKIGVILASLVAFTSLSKAQLVTNFGASADTNATTWVYNQGTSSLSGNEASGDLLFNTNPILLNLTGSIQIRITANVTTAPGAGFSFALQDGQGDEVQAAFSWASFIGGATITSALSTNVLFNYADVQGWNLVGGGSGAGIAATLTSATAVIPEPSTYALLALRLGGLVLMRMRSKRSSV